MKRRIIALLLGLLFGCYITPKELFHVFQHHTDTEHHVSNGLHIDEAHHHCALQKADQQLVSVEPPIFQAVFLTLVLFPTATNSFPPQVAIISPEDEAWFDRGPPCAFV